MITAGAEAGRMADETLRNAQAWAEDTTSQLLRQPTFNAKDLMAMEFPPITELVAGLIQTGLVLLVAAPKIGKSWFSLLLAYVAATGGYMFGAIKVSVRPVLYLALEDGPRRLQNRLRMLGFTDPPETLEFRVSLDPRTTLVDTVRRFLDDHADSQPLVILDTLGKYKVTEPRRTGETDYERDYRLVGDLCELVHSYDGATMLIVHHTRKMSSDDFLDSVSGTNGVAGAADAILKLDRKRGAEEGTLQVTSRDGPEGDYLLHFDSSNGMWTLDGDSLEAAAQAARDYRQTNDVGDLMADIIRAVGDLGETTPKDVADRLGITGKTAGVYLKRAADSGRIAHAKRGRYAPIEETND